MSDRLDIRRYWLSATVMAVGPIVAFALYTSGDASVPVCVLIIVQAIITGLIVRPRSAAAEMLSSAGVLETPFFLAHDARTFDRYRRISRALLQISIHSDRVYRDVVMQQLDKVAAQIEGMGNGTIVYHGTETWRIVYEQLLREPGLQLYRSVSLIRNPQYWQDGAGQQSMQLNLNLHEQGQVSIERICIVSDELWPVDGDMPHETIRQWIHEQSVHGIWVKLVRESTLLDEQELIRDMGIYGSRALGIQQLDEQGTRTRVFTLTFAFEAVREAEEQWKRLSVYAISYRDLVDQFKLGP